MWRVTGILKEAPEGLVRGRESYCVKALAACARTGVKKDYSMSRELTVPTWLLLLGNRVTLPLTTLNRLFFCSDEWVVLCLPSLQFSSFLRCSVLLYSLWIWVRINTVPSSYHSLEIFIFLSSMQLFNHFEKWGCNNL